MAGATVIDYNPHVRHTQLRCASLRHDEGPRATQCAIMQRGYSQHPSVGSQCSLDGVVRYPAVLPVLAARVVLENLSRRAPRAHGRRGADGVRATP